MKNELKIYLCDDDNAYANIVKNKFDNYFNVTVHNELLYSISIFNDGNTLLKAFDERQSQVVILDIDMPGIDGFEVASYIQSKKENVIIMFITNHEDRVYQSYEYHPFWFVRKSHISDLDTILPKLKRKIEVEQKKKSFTYNLKADNKIIELNINTLIYIEALRNDIVIKDSILSDIRVRCKISDAEKQLRPCNIIRIQKGLLVNCKYISKITSREVILINGTHLSLGRSRIEYVKTEYQKYVRSKLI